MDRPILLKLSGKALSGEPLAQVCLAIKDARAFGRSIVIVHGGGAQLDTLSARHGITPVILGGRRVTDSATLELAKLAFAGNGVDLTAALRAAGVQAIPLPAGAARVITAQRRPPQTILDEDGQKSQVDFGYVGDITAVDVQPVWGLLAYGIVPIISPLAMDDAGGIYNINADTLAARLAAALNACELVMVSDVPGIYADPQNPATPIAHLSRTEAQALVDRGIARGGMRPKLAAVEQALNLGVARVRICDANCLATTLAGSAHYAAPGGTVIA